MYQRHRGKGLAHRPLIPAEFRISLTPTDASRLGHGITAEVETPTEGRVMRRAQPSALAVARNVISRRIANSLALLSVLVGLSGFTGFDKPAPQSPETFGQRIPGTDVTLTMVYVTGGSFAMGSPEDEPGRDADEGPQRTVMLDPFWIGIHEVTHEQFSIYRYRSLDSEAAATTGQPFDVDAVSRPSPPYEDPAHGMGGDDHPASGMTQWAALQYARWLSLKTGRLYRLPTEAEWEYACRAGTVTAFPFGETPETLDAYAWYAANSRDRVQPVGQKSANGWGVRDMLGNVAEWTLDQYGAAAYATWPDSVHAPWTRPTSEHPRTVRGGAFDDEPEALRCADRLESTLRWKRRDPQLPKSRWWNTDSPHVGFRLVTPDRPFTIEEIRSFWADVLGS